MAGEDVAILRCKYCGAPLDPSTSADSRIVTCAYCGTSQERIDAEKYMNDVMTRVKSWVTKSLPMGYNMAGGETVDPVARHSIFTKDIGPKISVELMTYRMSLMTLLGNRLLVMPFRTAKLCQISTTSNDAFEFNARVKTVSSLAVTDEDVRLVEEASFISECYALAVNNINLLDEQKDGRWGILANNFNEAAKSIGKQKDFGNPAKRFVALGKVCEGFQKMFSGDAASGFGLVKEGKEMLQSLKDEVMNDAQFSMMFNAVEQELTMATIMTDLLEYTNSTGGDCLRMLEVIRNVMDAPVSVSDPNWKYITQNLHRYTEIFQNISEIITADAGEGVPIAQGNGNLLFPFWEVELRYTFVTGKLWAKRSVEVSETLFISSQFLSDAECLRNPASAVTDVFVNRPETRFMDSLKGRETTISGGCELAKLQKSISVRRPAGRKAVLPITRKMEAEKICSEYLNQKTKNDDKLRLSAPIVKRLVYVPCRNEGGNIVLPPDFGNLVPAHIGRINADKLMII